VVIRGTVEHHLHHLAERVEQVDRAEAVVDLHVRPVDELAAHRHETGGELRATDIDREDDIALAAHRGRG
jgi:hypothetical protein